MSFAAAATTVAQRVQHATGITIIAEPDLLGKAVALGHCLALVPATAAISAGQALT